MTFFKKILIFILVLLLTIPVILQYIYNWSIQFKINSKSFNISLYGIYLLVYLLLQFVFSSLNNFKWKSYINKRSANILNKINLMVVGYREDISYYRMCLESIKKLSDSAINFDKIIIIIDGNDQDDKYMVDLVREIFLNTTKTTYYLHLDDHILNEDQIHLYKDHIQNNDIICVSQKHSGKRDCMMSGFKITLFQNKFLDSNIETIFCTDSDTVIDTECITEMYKYFQLKNIGAVAGNLGIHNKYDSVISFMSSIRYWYAFNLERAYQSYAGNVWCVSGPIGMYRVLDLQEIIDEWNTQKFLGKRCTYGDDRHLTNKILSLQQKVIYIQSAYAETETPASWYRFFKQQTRWNKSAFRELLWTLPILEYQSLFMTVDFIYLAFYPFIVIGYLSYILWYRSVFELGIYSSIILIIGLVKSIYGTIRSGKFENMFYFLYVLVYITILFPSKILALLNITDNSWGTSSRKIISFTVSFDIFIPIIWNAFLISGITYNLTKSFNKNSTSDYYLFISNVSIYIVFTIVMFVYVNVKRINFRQNDLEKLD